MDSNPAASSLKEGNDTGELGNLAGGQTLLISFIIITKVRVVAVIIWYLTALGTISILSCSQ